MVELNPHLQLVEGGARLNPHLTVEVLMAGMTFELDGCTLQSWNLYAKGLTTLPDSIGDLTVGGNLYLNENQLTTLPESFGSLTVGGDLCLCRNQLITLPRSFPNVEGNIMLKEEDYVD